MTIDEDVVALIGKVLTAGGLSAYVIHSFYTRYNRFKEDIYTKMENRMTIPQCDKYRAMETARVDDIDEDIKRVDADLQRHKEAKQ